MFVELKTIFFSETSRCKTSRQSSNFENFKSDIR
eukprot:UN00119